MYNVADGGSMIHTFSTSGNETLQNDLSGELATTRIDTNGRNTVAFSKATRRIVHGDISSVHCDQIREVAILYDRISVRETR
jgi:hypothetical protein